MRPVGGTDRFVADRVRAGSRGSAARRTTGRAARSAGASPDDCPGGETAALLSTLPLQSLHLVDINEAQLSLTRLKLQLLQTADTPQRLALLGHTAMPPESRSRELSSRLTDLGLPTESLGPPQWVARYGPDHCGRYEWLFARMRQLLEDHPESMLSLMQMDDPDRQSKLVAEGTDLGDRIEQALVKTLDLNRLVRIFGPDATANRVQPFAQHFLQQTRRVLSTMPAVENPFLHQIFLGKFIGPLWPWLGCGRPASLPETRFSRAAMDEVLPTLPDGSYDLIHLSNILDWIKPSDAQRMLNSARRCLSPGGLVVIRQLNSRLDIRGLPCGLRWLPELSESLHEIDRSFFYRSLHVGMKR
jgi:S-adenosylmethionine-diacylglycerol 3-amino-3-carboxypropyl transferase